MYPYLFGLQSPTMYDLIGIFGYVIILIFYLRRKECFAAAREKNYFLLLLLVQFVAFTFGGKLLGGVLHRGTEAFGFLSLSAVFTILLALAVEGYPLRWLDHTVPLYLTLLSTLKLGCFCSGCCYGLPFRFGLYNSRVDEVQFPVQLAEMAAYALLLRLLWRYQGKAGQRFALFLTAYAAMRFAVQFIRGDKPVFSPFHWMSAVFVVIGATMWLICGTVGKRKVPRET